MNDILLNFALNYSKDVNVNIESYKDFDFANSIDHRHSISGYAFMLAGGDQFVGSRGIKGPLR